MLADRQDQRVERDLELGVRHVEWDLATGVVALAAVLGLGADQPAQLAVLDMQRRRLRQLDDLDALLDAGVDLLGIGRHLVDRPPVDEVHLVGADPAGRTHAVHGRVAGTDDADLGADRDRILLAHAAQEA